MYMNSVEPIRGKNIINKFADVLRSYSERDYVLFMTGLYLGRRISDILPLKVKDVKNKEYVYFREAKKNKESYLKINKKLQSIFKSYCVAMDDDDFLFAPLRGDKDRYISRQQYWNILNKAAAEIGYKDKIGCHSLRKTLGHELYASGVDITMIMLVLGHDDVNYTKRYIGVTADEVNDVLAKLSF